ncbi:MAG TPA: AraC family transcriptional regulator ligand-binding domain-containing protein, partial [Hyphomonadaceae bacterium]
LPQFERPDEFVSSRNLNLLLNAAAAATHHPDLGLRWGEITELSFLGPLYIAMENSDTVRDAMDLAAAYVHVHSPVTEVIHTPLPGRTDDFVGVRSRMAHPPPMMQMYERHVVLLHRMLNVMCCGQYRPVEVWFQHQRISPLYTYRKIFGADPDFGRPQSGIVVERSALAAYRAGRNHQLLAMAETYLSNQPPRSETSIAPDVTNMLRVMIESEDCTAAQVARALGLHERTMQRRLQACNTSLEQLKDGVLRELAVMLLRDPDVQISCIAWKLHYANGSAFTRACQRWFGASPREVRQRLLKSRPLEVLEPG